MPDVPVETPVTTPVPVTVATTVVVLLQMPAVPVGSNNDIDREKQTADGPVITGCGLMFITCVVKQPVTGNWYVIVAVLTAELPVKTPVAMPVGAMVAIAVLLLLHPPPGVISLSVADLPAQMALIPV